MICVSIGRGRHKHMAAEHRHLVEQGAQLVELRLDYITRDVNLKRLLPERPCETIVTCRRESDGGKWTGSEQERIMLLRAAIAEGVEYVDLEEDIAADVPRFGATKRVVSLHDFNGTPDDLPAIHRRLAALDPDVIKIATMAHNPHDNLRMLELVRQAKVPTVGLCMGEVGTPSRILATRFGAPFTYGTFHHERSLAPGQLSFRQMTDIYFHDEIDAQTEVYGAVADPVGHHLGPLVYNAAFRHAKLNKLYLPFRVPQEHLARFLEDGPAMGIRGLSVSLPHKEAVLRHCTKIDGAVRGVAAADTMLFEGDDVLAHNYDYRAAMESIDNALGVSGEDALAGKTALVLGAGGVAKAAVFGFKRRSAKVVVSGRTFERSAKLALRNDCRAVAWEKRNKVKADIVFNGTPVGMHPNVDEAPLDADALRTGTLVFETVYNPEHTLLVKQASKQGCRVITGVEMFLRQAGRQYRAFTGLDAPMELMHDVMKRATGAVRM